MLFRSIDQLSTSFSKLKSAVPVAGVVRAGCSFAPFNCARKSSGCGPVGSSSSHAMAVPATLRASSAYERWRLMAGILVEGGLVRAPQGSAPETGGTLGGRGKRIEVGCRSFHDHDALHEGMRETEVIERPRGAEGVRERRTGRKEG